MRPPRLSTRSLATPFSEGERHKRRIALLADYEATGKIIGLPAD